MEIGSSIFLGLVFIGIVICYSGRYAGQSNLLDVGTDRWRFNASPVRIIAGERVGCQVVPCEAVGFDPT